MSALNSLHQSFDESIVPLRQRWLLLAPREQNLLRILAIFLALVFLVYGVWLPSHRGAEKFQRQYEKNRELIALMQSQTGAGNGASSQATGSILSMVSGSATGNSLTLSRIEPEGGDKVRVWLERADFNRIATWLAGLHTQGIVLKEAHVEKQSDGSGVTARFLLTR